MLDHRNIPRLVIAGVSSGVGKTTMFTGLCRALRQRGLQVSAFKIGPDYLDPTYHARASGAVSHTLDGWMMGREAVLRTFYHGSVGSDIALIEGVMGLFDGASIASEEGSTAEIAKWLKAPVLAVVDSSGISRTIDAIGRGLRNFDPDVCLAGLLCNRVGSKGHIELLRQASTGVPVLGGLPLDLSLKFPERHLGLCPATTDLIADETLATLGKRVAEWCDLQRIVNIAGDVPEYAYSDDSYAYAASHGVYKRCRIGIARDAAFHFYYEENLRQLRKLGAELVVFSPLRDSRLPLVDGLYLGGGYPELYADELSSNHLLRNEIAEFAASGKPIYAECGGLMYLSTSIRTADGSSHPMAGVLNGETIMHERLQALGYMEVETTMPSIIGAARTKFRGHQFRYSEFIPNSQSLAYAYEVRRRRDGKVIPEGFATKNVLASYVHAHWASNPDAAAGFVASCIT